MSVDTGADEQRLIRRQLNDLTAILALPAMWKGQAPPGVADSMLDILGSLLRLDVAHARLAPPLEGCPEFDLLWPRAAASAERLLTGLDDWSPGDEAVAVTPLPDPEGGAPLRVATLRRRLLGAAWRVAAGSRRPDFPTDAERFLLGVTVEQAAIAIETAVLLGREQTGRRAAEQAREEALQARAEAEAARREAQVQAEIHVQLNAALRESEARFRNMADNAPVMLWVTGPDAACTYLNHQWYDFTGQTPATGLGLGWLDAVHPDDHEWSGATFLEANRERRAFRLEYRLRRRDGAYRWAIDAAAPRFGPDGAFLGYIGSVIDITERKLAEEERERAAQAVRESEQRYRSLFETAAVSIWEEDFSAVTALVDDLKARGVRDLGAYLDEHPEVVDDAIGRVRIRDVNAQTLAMFGAASKDELLASLATTFMPETTRVFRDEMIAIAEGRRTFVAEAPLRTLRGERRDVLVTIAFPEPGRRFDRVPVALTDITERTRAEEERQRLEREKDAFLATASHDLKNPLASIKGSAQLIGRQMARGTVDPARLAARLASIDSAASQMVVLIDALLDLTRLRMGRPLELERQPTDLVTLARRVATEQQATSERHRIVVDSAEAELVGPWDARRLERVLGNLLSNAVKYSPRGGPITVAVARDAEAGGAWAVLTVGDRGLGIPARDLPRIFEHFHRAENVAGAIPGTGVGLAGARQIVEQHGGTIAVESREGEGSAFTVRLPLARDPESGGTIPAAAEAIPRSHRDRRPSASP